MVVLINLGCQKSEINNSVMLKYKRRMTLILCQNGISIRWKLLQIFKIYIYSPVNYEAMDNMSNVTVNCNY
jgi:hypothetical protein